MMPRSARLFRSLHATISSRIAQGARPLLSVALLLAFFVAPAVRLYSQIPGGDTLRLTVDDLLTRISTTSPELLRERLEIERASAARSRVAFFPSRPELEFSMASDAPFDDIGEGEWELELSQEIELAGQYFLRSRAADLTITQAELRVRAVELGLRAEARGAFARLAAAESRLRLIDTLLAFSRRLDTVAGRLLAAEEISELDRNAVRIQRGREEIGRLGALDDLTEARTELARLLSVSPRTIITIDPRFPDGLTQRDTYLDTLLRVESALADGDESVLRRRPDWQALDRARERVEVERDLASRGWVPNLHVGLGYIDETKALAGDHHSAEEVTLRNDRLLGLRLGIQLPLPFAGLYDPGQGDIALANVELSVIEAERARLATRIRADLMRASARLRTAAEAHRLYATEIAPLVRRNIRLLEIGYTAGELSATEVISQQQQFAGAADALIDAEREYMEALADFQRALGE